VNYTQSYSDFCTGFVAHCVERAKNMDAARALDILCRPWAPPEPPPTMSSYKKSTRYKYLKNRIPLGKRRGTKMRKITVFMPSDSEDEGGPYKEVEDNRPLSVYFRDAPQPPEDWLQRINTALCKELTPPPSYDSEDEESSDFYDDSERDDDDSVLGYDRAEERSLALPSWVRGIDKSAFALFRQPGINSMIRMGRTNADPVVGLPGDGHRIYSAALNKG